MMKLVLVRHGESEWNKRNLFTGWHDVANTSYLKRAIHTLNHILDEMDRNWIPVNKAWQLNERHYGALQGLNKAETAANQGDALPAIRGVYGNISVGDPDVPIGSPVRVVGWVSPPMIGTGHGGRNALWKGACHGKRNGNWKRFF